jgi:RNA polymerase sigma factor for flagellar operon FliA
MEYYKQVAVYTEVETKVTTSDELVNEYAPLVKRIGYHLLNRLPNSVQLDDLLQSGMLGLLEAHQSFDVNKEASFSTFAGIRIRGAMIDYLRKNSSVSRTASKNIRLISQAISAVEAKIGGRASTQQIAEQLGVTLDEYHKMSQHAYASNFMSFDEVEETHEIAGNEISPAEALQSSDMKTKVMGAIQNLPEREKMILSLYYTDELTFKEIALVLKLTEARISQLHTQAIARIKTRFKETNDE